MKLIQSEKMASLGVLTAGVAHEINNPLNYIMGSYSALKTYAEEKNLPEETHFALLLKNMKVGLDKATAIVKGLNQFSRDNKSKDETCFVHEVMDNCLSILNNQIKNRITVIRNYTDAPVYVRGNAGQLHQAFLNILTNAVQSMSHKGEIEIVTAIFDDALTIKIRDTGEGIPAENISRITDPFFTTKDPGKGTGLGLSITYSIIRDHQGALDFFSEPGKGTVVEVRLPQGR